MRVNRSGEALLVVEVVEALLELTLDQPVFAERLPSVELPLAPRVSGAMGGARGRRNFAGPGPRRRALRGHPREQDPIEVARVEAGRDGVERREAPPRLGSRGQGEIEGVS